MPTWSSFAARLYTIPSPGAVFVPLTERRIGPSTLLQSDLLSHSLPHPDQGIDSFGNIAGQSAKHPDALGPEGVLRRVEEKQAGDSESGDRGDQEEGQGTEARGSQQEGEEPGFRSEKRR